MAYRKRKTGYGLFMTEEGKAYKSEIAWRAKELWKDEPYSGKMRMALFISWKDERRRDVDNFLKLTKDALEGIVFVNDSQVEEIFIKRQRIGRERVLIKLWSLEESKDTDASLGSFFEE